MPRFLAAGNPSSPTRAADLALRFDGGGPGKKMRRSKIESGLESGDWILTRERSHRLILMNPDFSERSVSLSLVTSTGHSEVLHSYQVS